MMFLVACAVVLLVGCALAFPWRGSARDAGVRETARSAPLAWYLDEACQTGDLVFIGTEHVGLLFVHPDTGEPWLVELLDGGTAVQPARGRLLGCDDDLRVLPIAMPVSGTAVVAVVAGMDQRPESSSQLVAHVLRQLRIPLPAGCERPSGLWRAAAGSTAYGGPVTMEK